ncbi:unnamed protein product [Spirodela intermedia]|uniref:Uncharacterized protein n=1 Tax=Spirodela intermedia TaxID=51605 RepID=A0A7I8KM09_SPIIN|nr:unnamed protein product [Spirodela intermedia]
MKNAAKCDTWCELQNPANHRIFERKLRPRPSGRGHACLGAGRPCAARARRAEALGPAAPRRVVGVSVHRRRGRRPSSGRREEERRTEPRRERGATPAGPAAVGPRPQVRRGHPPSLSI